MVIVFPSAFAFPRISLCSRVANSAGFQLQFPVGLFPLDQPESRTWQSRRKSGETKQTNVYQEIHIKFF